MRYGQTFVQTITCVLTYLLTYLHVCSLTLTPKAVCARHTHTHTDTDTHTHTHAPRYVRATGVPCSICRVALRCAHRCPTLAQACSLSSSCASTRRVATRTLTHSFTHSFPRSLARSFIHLSSSSSVSRSSLVFCRYAAKRPPSICSTSSRVPNSVTRPWSTTAM